MEEKPLGKERVGGELFSVCEGELAEFSVCVLGRLLIRLEEEEKKVGK
ncbi:hypothetical protein COLO4_11285 [Corchorus olitorius]|uniref:Uncharacterized protein n=1 Tax=Corchorus olitorius TaxID=93759 RepID=A0A1R3K530_9ROSI|nr:hypothetical protein COLO4_11285 [Corchorus olitorius]